MKTLKCVFTSCCAILLCAAIFFFAACGKASPGKTFEGIDTEPINQDANTTAEVSSVSSEDNEDSLQVPVKEYHLGETVSTDILEFTLDYAEFAISLHNGTAGDWNYICLPKDYDSVKDSNSCFVAAIGHTLISLQFTAKNLNRVDTSFANTNNPAFLTVHYQETDYAWECNSGLYPSKDGYDWNGVEHEARIKPQETLHFRTSADIATSVGNVSDPFLITFALPMSTGEVEQFMYSVTEEDIKGYKDSEISLEEAISSFRYDKAHEYFNNHLSEFKKLDTEEILALTQTEGAKMLLCMQNESVDKKGNVFDGKSKITYFYKTTQVTVPYKVAENILQIDMNSTSYRCSVYMIKDNTYLLLNEGKVFGIILIEI